MRIACQTCQKHYKIADERIPEGKKRVLISCPNCGGRIIVDLSGRFARTTPSVKGGAESGPAPAASRAPGILGNDSGALKKKILSSLTLLPPMPQAVFKAQKIIADERGDLKRLSQVIKADPGLVSRVLKLANSSLYGLSGKVSSIEHATVLLGQQNISEIISIAAISKLLDNRLDGYNLDSGDLWRHSIAVALAAKMVGNLQDSELTNDCFIAGLLHDTGKIVLDRLVVERKAAFEKYLEDGERSIAAAEKHILGFDHAEIAFEMCRRWQIPAVIATAIRFHHRPSGSHGDRLCYILHMADYVATLSGIGVGLDYSHCGMEKGTMKFLDVSQKALSEWVLRLIEMIDQMNLLTDSSKGQDEPATDDPMDCKCH